MTLTPKRREALAAALEERRCPQAKEHGVCMHELCYEDKFAAAAMRAVMGRGVALQAKSRFPGIEHALGKLIREYGNHVGVIPRLAGWPPVAAISFPVKHHWRQAARSRLDYPFGQGTCLDFGGALDDYRSPPSWVWQRTPSLGECRTLSGRAR